MTSVAAALAAARAGGVSQLDAQLMLSGLLGCSRTQLIAGDDRLLTELEAALWSTRLARRAAGEPLAYVLGEKEFYGLMFEVGPGVLVPRPETELLVDWAGELLRAMPDSTAVADLGTGSGAVAVALKVHSPWLAMTATDASAQALDVARRNARRHDTEIDFAEGSWWSPLGGRRFGLVVSNPPYIAAGDAHLAALRHEPALALTPGGDGLGALAEIVAGAAPHMAPGGWLLVEHGFDQAEAVRSLFHRAGFEAVTTRRDLAGQPRTTGGVLP